MSGPLRAADDRFRLLLDSVRDYAIFLLDTEGRVATWNLGAERLKGYSAEQILGQHFSRFYPPDDVASGKPAWELELAAAQGRVENEGWRIRRDGSTFWANVVITALRDEAGRLVGFGKVTRDLTERKRAEEALRVSNEELARRVGELVAANAELRVFRLLVEHVRDYAIYMLDPDGRVMSWNPGAQHIKGYSADEIIGRHFSHFYPPEDVAAGKPAGELAAASAEGRFEDEGWRVRKDGGRFWANVVVTALRDDQGRLLGFAKVTRDLTQRRRAEEERARLAREQAARAEAETAVRARDAFLARASHELRTPLTSALGTIRLLRRAMAGNLDERPEELVDIADRNLKAISALVNDQLDVVQLDGANERLKLEVVDLAEAVRNSLLVLRSEAREKRLVLESAVPDGLTVPADHFKLEQVLVNLLANAVKFTPEGGRVSVEALRDEKAVTICVRDTGPGIEPEHLELIFEPFFRAPQAGGRSHRGTGLGLAICRRIVALHGGRIWAESEGPGRGSTFAVRLPLRSIEGRAA